MTSREPEAPDSNGAESAPTDHEPASSLDADDRDWVYGESPDGRIRWRGWIGPGRASQSVTIDGHLNTPAAIAETLAVMERAFAAGGPTGRVTFSLGLYRCQKKAIVPLADLIRRRVDEDGAKVHLVLWVGQPAGDLMQLAGITLRSARIDDTDLYGRFDVELDGEIR
jgi:hypothetical protein